MKRRLVIAAMLLITGAAVAGANVELSLKINELRLNARRDAHTEARLAEWNSPMGRLQYFLDEEYARLLRGGQPGATSALAFRIKAQPGLPLELVASAVESGVETSRARVIRIPWPWHAADPSSGTSLEEELAEELGERLVLRPR